MYVVRVRSGQFDYWLRGTVWAMAQERATRYESHEAAQKALTAARKYTKFKLWKTAVVEAA